MMRRIHFAVLILVISAASSQTRGQSLGGGNAARTLEVTLAYNAVRSNGSTGACACFWMQGGKAEFNVAIANSISLVGELGVQHVSDINSASQDLGLMTYLFGPRFSFRRYSKFTPFGQVLLGGVHGFDGYFPNPNNSTATADAFALAAGGGLNIAVSRHLAIRPVQADYLLTELPNDAADRENSLRLGAGIVFLMGPSK